MLLTQDTVTIIEDDSMKKRTVLITGDLAAGKTTFAKKLSKHLGIDAICKDEIKEILAETVGFSNRAENKRLSQAAFKISSIG